MFSEDHPSRFLRPANRQPYGQSSRPPYRQPYAQRPPRPFVQEDTLNTSNLQVERKYFELTLKDNPKGRFLRITEMIGGKRNSIIVPASGLKDFQRQLGEMLIASEGIPAKSESAPID
jgi:hypothetical protein